MELSNIIYSYRNDNLINYYSSPFDNCVSLISMNEIYRSDDAAIGINCFNELLFKNDLIYYAK